MRLARALFSTMAVVSMLSAGSCGYSNSTGGGGAGSTGATSEVGGNSGASASAGASAGASAQAGSTASGGASSSAAAGQGGNSATGGKSQAGGAGAGGTSAQAGAGGTNATGGRTATGGGGGGQSGSAGAGGTAAAGNSGTATSPGGGNTGAGGTGAAGSTGSGATGEPVKSAGCGKTPTLKGGTAPLTIMSTRKYYLRIPDGYDNSHAYRLVVAYAESGSSAESVMKRDYFKLAGYDPKNTVFVAPDAVGSTGQWSKTDVDFTDKIVEEVEGDLCIDKTRLFATGFSFGGAMSIAIACTRADVFRGVAFFSGADLTNSCPATLTKPIAYWASQASGDASGPPTAMSGRTFQKRFAEVNGCTADENAINFPAAGQPHTCTIYKNCKPGFPTIYCVFNGGHSWDNVDPGQSTPWGPKEAWAFITQF